MQIFGVTIYFEILLVSPMNLSNLAIGDLDLSCINLDSDTLFKVADLDSFKLFLVWLILIPSMS